MDATQRGQLQHNRCGERGTVGAGMDPLTDPNLISSCAGTVADATDTPAAPTKRALCGHCDSLADANSRDQCPRRGARRHHQRRSDHARDAFDIGPQSAAEAMIVAGDNPRRLRCEAAFAKICGPYPIPASSGNRPPAPGPIVNRGTQKRVRRLSFYVLVEKANARCIDTEARFAQYIKHGP